MTRSSQERTQNGLRTWVVDHETWSMINEATEPSGKLQHDDIGLLAFIVAFMFAHMVIPKL